MSDNKLVGVYESDVKSPFAFIYSTQISIVVYLSKIQRGLAYSKLKFCQLCKIHMNDRNFRKCLFMGQINFGADFVDALFNLLINRGWENWSKVKSLPSGLTFICLN